MKNRPKHIEWLANHSIWYRRALAPLVFALYVVCMLIAFSLDILRNIWKAIREVLSDGRDWLSYESTTLRTLWHFWVTGDKK